MDTSAIYDDNIVPKFTEEQQLNIHESLSELQNSEIRQSRQNLENLDKDINTIRRQVEIIENSSLKKGNTIFIFKTTLTFLCVFVILKLLARSEIIPQTVALYGGAIFGLISLFVILLNLKSVWSRDNNRFNVRKFNKPENNTRCIARTDDDDFYKVGSENGQLKNLSQTVKDINTQREELKNKKRDLLEREKQLKKKLCEMD